MTCFLIHKEPLGLFFALSVGYVNAVHFSQFFTRFCRDLHRICSRANVVFYCVQNAIRHHYKEIRCTKLL